MSPIVVGRRAILWMIAGAAIVEVSFNAIEVVLPSAALDFLLWTFGTMLLFGLTVVIERYKLLRET